MPKVTFVPTTMSFTTHDVLNDNILILCRVRTYPCTLIIISIKILYLFDDKYKIREQRASYVVSNVFIYLIRSRRPLQLWYKLMPHDFLGWTR